MQRRIDPVVSGFSPYRWLSVISSVGMTKCGDVEIRPWTLLDKQKLLIVQMPTFDIQVSMWNHVYKKD